MEKIYNKKSTKYKNSTKCKVGKFRKRKRFLKLEIKI